MIAVATALFVVLVVFGALACVHTVGGTLAAWSYVVQGFEATALWAALGITATRWLRSATEDEAKIFSAACAWGAVEAIERPLCRLAFPMDQKPPLPKNQNLCEAAFGVDVMYVSVFFAALLCVMCLEYLSRLYASR
jgi:hypothetical protein